MKNQALKVSVNEILFVYGKVLKKVFFNQIDDEDIFAEDDVPNSAVDLLNKDKVGEFFIFIKVMR